MNNTDYMIHLLARTIKTGKDELITPLIIQLSDMQVSRDLLEKHNLPALVAEYAPFNEAAKSLSKSVLAWKYEEIAQEMPQLLKEFVQIAKEKRVPEEFMVRLVTSLMDFDDLDTVRSCLEILNHFEFSLDEYEELGIYRKATQFEGQFRDADEIIAKVDVLLLQDEILEEDEAEVEADDLIGHAEENEEEENDFSDDESVISETESGIYTDEELELEDHFEAVRKEDRKDQVMTEICMMLLAGYIRSGNSEVISAAIKFTWAFDYSLEMYQKYDIQNLIYNFGVHNDDAELLMNHIKELQARELFNENRKFFKRFLRTCMEEKTITDSVLSYLKGFLENGDDYMVSCTLKFLLGMPITLSQFKTSHVEACLENLESGPSAQLGFMLKMKIQKLEHSEKS